MVRCSKALEFGVCTHLELLNASVHLSLNKDGSDGMNSQNKDIFDSFLRLIFLWQSWYYPRAKGLQIFQRFAKFRNTGSMVCLSMNLYCWRDLVGKQC